MKNILRHIWLVVLAAIVASSCQREAESLEADYGYVQLRLQRSTFIEGTSATRATDRLEWLADAHKITVIMQHDGSTITQTLLLSYYDRESAEWGVSSEKLRLLTGSYNIIGYYLYDIRAPYGYNAPESIPYHQGSIREAGSDLSEHRYSYL